MGFTPREVDRMTMDELAACADGWARANGAKPKMSAEKKDKLKAMLMKAKQADG